MRRILVIALASTALASPAFAQTAVGIGVSRSDSTAVSSSRSTAIGGGNAQARGGTGIGVGQGGNVNIAGTPAVTTQNLVTSGTSTVKNVPSVFSPGLAAAGLETCLGSVSGGGSFVGTGFSFGSTIPDPGCAARLDARTLWSMGLKKAAIARLCLGADIQRAMPEICYQYLPQAQPVGGVNPYILSASATYSGGPIMLIEGKTGAERLCNDYDSTKQRCRAWDGAAEQPSHHRSKRMAKAVIPTPTASPLTSPPVIGEKQNLEGTAK